MPIQYGKFELPVQIELDETADANTYARFLAGPFERGYGHTVGNFLRRVLLTSIESPSLISVKFEGIPHEYKAVEGIVEDVTHIILNLKGAKLRKLPTDETKNERAPQKISKDLEVTQEMLDKNGGQYVVTFADIMGPSTFELINPEHKIFTATQVMKRRVDVKVAIGRGYVPSERLDLKDKVADEILVDAIFSPVTLVNYFVENTRVGQDTDFDKLVLEVTTDGRITPKEALTYAVQIATLHFKVFEELEYEQITFETEEQTEDTDRDILLAKLCQKISEIELSVRSTNCLVQADIGTIAELVLMPESDMLKFRNFGKKSLNEIKAKLTEMELSLGMDLSKYGITRENVMEEIETYMNEKKSGTEG